MHNWYAIESEAAFRRDEWQRAVAADARAAQARPVSVTWRWPRFPRLALPRLSALATPRRAFTAAPPARCGALVC